jgi:O-glycosyl hydrolase
MGMDTSKFLPNLLGSLSAALFWTVLRTRVETKKSDLINPQLLETGKNNETNQAKVTFICRHCYVCTH